MKNEMNKGLKGAIVGDIIGSVYEWHNIKTKEFPLFSGDCSFTDDTVMSVAVAKALMDSHQEGRPLNTELVATMQTYGRVYRGRGYGHRFKKWIYDSHPEPYNSWGNGAPMRCSGAGMLAASAEEAYALGKATAMPTHNHEHALTAAGVTASIIWMANHGASMEELRQFAETKYSIPTCDELRPGYDFDVSSQGTMPAALAAFLESRSFEDAIRNAISLGGDSDTIAAITGSMAEAYWGLPVDLWRTASRFLDKYLLQDVNTYYLYVNGDLPLPWQYKTETHLHTAETSHCAKNTAAEMIEACAFRGYNTVIVTDHYSHKYFNHCAGDSYEEKVEHFFDGYEAAKAAGKKCGITVLFGVELRLKSSRNHYLVYGITKEFLLRHPEILSLTIQEFHSLAKANGMLVIQAHPFRRSSWPTPDCVDGLEVRNTNPKYYRPEEESYIEKIARGYHLIQTAGSDTHEYEAAGLSGILTDVKIDSMETFLRVLKSGEFSIF